MYFKKLEMHGFKSFAEPVTIEFHNGITCIVGPNGSGKSNVSDAIRWVLGEQSPKMLRGDKMDQVIFAGTENRKSRGMAEVTLTIDNESGKLPIDYNEIAITRRMYRSGESEYLINGNQCRLKDIRELIMDTGIGVDGYSLIGQGKIAEMVSNKPESRREIFEESAGVVMYKNKKAEAERKLNSANVNLDRVNDIITEIEGRIGTLREDSIKAKEYLKLKERYEELEINLTLRDIESAEKSLADMKSDISEFKKEIDTLKDKKKTTNIALTDDKRRNKALQELSEENNKALLQKIDEINRLTNKGQIDNERLSAIGKDLTRLDEEIKEVMARIESENNNKNALEDNIKEIDKEIEASKVRLDEKIDYYNECNDKAVTLLEEVEQAKDDLFNLRSEINSKTSEIRSYQSMKEALEKQKKELIDDFQRGKAEGKELASRLATAKEDRENLEREFKEIQAELLGASERESVHRKSNVEIQKKLEDFRIKKSQLLSRQKTIEEMESNYDGYTYAVKFIMHSDVSGIDGVVADLMKVPKEYEIAVETALGGTLQNVVCENENSAKKGVNLLKMNKAGRLTFLPVNSIRPKHQSIPDDLKSETGFMGMANECITFEKKYTGIFEYLLGRVAIVDSMDTAIRLSKKSGNIRFVTLEGEIVNVSGAITGGKYKNKTAGILSRKGEVDALAYQIRELDEKIAEERNAFESNKKDLHRVRQVLEEMAKEKSSLEIKLATAENNYNNLKSLAEDIGMEQGEFDAKMNNLENDYKNLEDIIVKLNEEISQARAKIGDVNASIGMKTAAQASAKIRSEEASENITKARIEETELINKKESAQNLIAKVEEAIADYNGQIEIKNIQISNLGDEKSKILYGNDDTEEQVELKKKEKQELEDYIEQAKLELLELEETTKNRMEELGKIEENLASVSDQKYNIELKMAKREAQSEAYKEKLWDEFEISYVEAMDRRSEDFVVSKAKKESYEVKKHIKELGDVNIGAIKEYEVVGERYEHLTTQREDIRNAMNELNAIISDMENTIKRQFKDNFDKIVDNFEKTFKELFGGGHAELRLEGSDNPLEAGIEIVAQPPGKKLQNINLMSGGEKTMTAIALMFAVLKTKPTPFCILDEVEAALDDANIDRFGEYLKNFKDIQFALVTHQKVTMEHADVLYGVTMPEQGVSKVLSLKLEDNFELE